MAVQTVEDTGSLRDHEASFHGRREAPAPVPAPVAAPAVEETVEAEAPPPATEQDIAAAKQAEAEAANPALRYAEPDKPRHRAQSQKASPADVPEIAELTKQLRSKEAELLKLKPSNGQTDSPRLVALRRQIRGLEAELADLQPKPQPKPAIAEQRPAITEPSSAITTFSEKEPQLADFEKEDDPYSAHLKAWARWDRRRDQFEQQQVFAKTAAERAEHETARQIHESYQTRLVAYAQQHPDFQTRLNQLVNDGYEIGPLATIALKTLDNGPDLVYKLTHQPALVAELALLTDGKAITGPSVAATQRWLQTRVTAVSTGAASPSVPVKRASPPPTPVRTGPMRTGDEPPDDGASLADHERFYNQARRRR